MENYGLFIQKHSWSRPLNSGSFYLLFEAAWALTNIAASTSEHTRVVIQHSVVPKLVQLLSSGNADVREQSVWALGNIDGDSPSCRDYVLSQGAMVPLLSQFCKHSKESILRNTTWTLSNLCRGKPAVSFEQVRGGVVEFFSCLNLVPGFFPIIITCILLCRFFNTLHTQ